MRPLISNTVADIEAKSADILPVTFSEKVRVEAIHTPIYSVKYLSCEKLCRALSRDVLFSQPNSSQIAFLVRGSNDTHNPSSSPA